MEKMSTNYPRTIRLSKKEEEKVIEITPSELSWNASVRLCVEYAYHYYKILKTIEDNIPYMIDFDKCRIGIVEKEKGN